MPDQNAIFERTPRLSPLLREIAGVAAQINARGWAEANAGNISVNISPFLDSEFQRDGEWFLVSRSGSRYRQMALDPLSCLVLVNGTTGTISPREAVPTSEWQCHRLLQELFLKDKRKDRVVLHAHPSAVILLSQLTADMDDEAINAMLCADLPELKLFLPDGVARAPLAAPGSPELAKHSGISLGNRKALIWQSHGLLTTAETPDLALDLMEVVEKAASLALHRIALTNSLS